MPKAPYKTTSMSKNVARAEVGDQPLIWDNKVVAYAQNYAN